MSVTNPAAESPSTPRPLCIHCQKHKRTRPRGLCRKCHQDPEIRELHPPVSPHGRRMPAFMDTVGPRPLPRKGTTAAPGSEEKIRELQERIALGLNPFSPLDRPMDPEVDRWQRTARPAPVLATARPSQATPVMAKTRPVMATARPARQLLLPFDPPLEEAPAAERGEAPSREVRRAGVVVIRQDVQGLVRIGTARRARPGKNVLAVIHTSDRDWLAAHLEKRWRAWRAGEDGFRLPKQERWFLPSLFIWERGKRPALQLGLFEKRPHG